jgi:hypothetical protein
LGTGQGPRKGGRRDTKEGRKEGRKQASKQASKEGSTVQEEGGVSKERNPHKPQMTEDSASPDPIPDSRQRLGFEMRIDTTGRMLWQVTVLFLLSRMAVSGIYL